MRRKFQVSLRFIMLSIFITLFCVVMSCLLTINYIQASRSLLYTGEQLMHEMTTSLYNEFVSELELAAEDNYFSSELLSQNVLNPLDANRMATYFTDMAKQFHIMQAIYWGDESGNFVSAEYESDMSITSEIINRNAKHPYQSFVFHTPDGKIKRKVESTNVSYDPRNRLWYKEAKKSGKTIWTDVYAFSAKPWLGVTLATPVYTKEGKLRGVLGLDLRLDWFSSYLSEKNISPSGVVFVVAADGKLIAYPGFEKMTPKTDQEYLVDIHSANIPSIAAAFDAYTKNPRPEFHFQYDGEDYLAVFKVIPHFASRGWLIGAVSPENDFTMEVKKALVLNVGLTIIVLIIAILALSALVGKVVNPLKKLVQQAEKIKHFDLQEGNSVTSKIKEVMLLSNAIESMKKGLRSFQRYVPASLVRQLIETGEDARIGGSRRQLVAFFTDIEGFTHVSETMSPDQLMEYMCEYFEALSNVIIQEQGTIDKYIGDSIMAYWGAPIEVSNAHQHAARTALTLIQRLKTWNEKWRAKGRIPLITRIGIDEGEAIVGNVGSADRMNYTALGDTVNVAQRLENINKQYDTHIMVSQSMFYKIKETFVLRMVDCVILKGKTHPEYIYELLTDDKEKLTFNLDEYKSVFSNAFLAYQRAHWLEAIHLFKRSLAIYPEDSLATVFIKRCQAFQLEPPEDWDGIWREF